MFIWLLETLQRYNVFGVVSFLLPFVLFCYHAFLLKRNKTEKKERARPVDAEPEETAENHSSSSSNEEEDDDENDEKTVDLTKKNCYDAPNLIYQENHERNSEIRIEDCLAEFYGIEDVLVAARCSVVNCLTVLCQPSSTTLVCCDEKINEKLRDDLLRTRLNLIHFRHNNPYDLKLQIREIVRNRKIENIFVILEVICGQTGTVCDLGKFVEVCKEERVRIVLDVCVSFAVYGLEGTAIECDLLVGNLGAFGCFCAGSKVAVERLRDAWCLTSTAAVSGEFVKVFQAMKERSSDLRRLAERVHRFLSGIKQYQVVSDCVSPLKIFKVAIGSTRENYDKTVRNFCKEHSVHLLLNENGLLMYLNVNLCCNEIKLARLLNVLRNAARFCVEKEQLMQIL